MTARFAIATALIVSLGACGSGKQETTETTEAVPAASETVPAETDAATPAPGASETPDAAASDAATPTPSPTPTPSASASKAAPSPAATVAAASGPPEAFKQCAVCHKTTAGDNLIGPSLAGVFGAKAGHVASFKYSQAMASSGLTWNAATLDKYLTDPKAVVPGTIMAFGGVKDDAKRKAIIDYLKTL